MIPVKPIALFKMRDEKGEDDKVVCVPTHDPGWNHAETLDDIPEQLQREITHFFSVYKQLEGKDVEVDGWRSREEALEVIEDGRRLQARGRGRSAPRQTGRTWLRLPRSRGRLPRAQTSLRRTFPVQDRGLAAYIAELVGTFFLVFFVTSVVDPLRRDRDAAAQFGSDFAVVGLVHGFVLFGLILMLGGVSGGHFNPAVTPRRWRCSGSTRSTRSSTSSPSSPAASSARC